MDYFDKVGVYHATELGVQKALYAMYLAQVKPVIYKKYGKYESSCHLHLPVCMIHGPLKDELSMCRGSKVFKFLMD